MFIRMEKEYKKTFKERSFNIYYWSSAIIIILIANLFSYIFEDFNTIKYYFIYITLLIFVVFYFYVDFTNVIKSLNVKNEEKLLTKIKIYIDSNRKDHIDKLINILRESNFKTKSDLKLAIDYYSQKQSIKIESNFLAWIVSVILTLSSFIEIAYDSETKMLDFQKISVILSTAAQYTIIFLIPIIFIYWIVNFIFHPKKKLYLELNEDLSYIYLNFNKFKSKLNKER